MPSKKAKPASAAPKAPPSKVRDPKLAGAGRARIAWARDNMPVLRQLEAEFAKERPLEGVRLAACLHVTKETAVLMGVLKAGGAEVALCGSNPLSTQDDVAAALAADGINVYAWRGVNEKEYYQCVDWALDTAPHFTMDDGGDLVTRLHLHRPQDLGGVRGGTEETTTGVTRFRAMAAEGALKYPIVAVNDADTKHMFDNRYGTGQSTLDGIVRGTSMLLAGKSVVVAGYGWCGRGVASRARGLGARITVSEVDPVRALEALMDGFDVATMREALETADLVITVTGNKSVIGADEFRACRDGVVLANSGHFDHEIDVSWLRKNAKSHRNVRDGVDEYALADGTRIRILGEGRLVNLALAEGHPPDVMDMSFANQALCTKHLVENVASMKAGVYPVPKDIDREVAARKLDAMGVAIDRMSEAQKKYVKSWKEGT